MLKIRYNLDCDKVSEVKDAIKNNDGYCPCKLLHNEDTRCMCKEFREQSYAGKCHCELFEKYEIS